MDSVNQELLQFDQTHPEEAKKVRAALIEATHYLTQFRADNIVRDAESIKDALLQSLEEGTGVSFLLIFSCHFFHEL